MIIDAHVHYPDDHPDLIALLSSLDVLALNITFANLAKPHWRTEAARYRDLAERLPRHFRWCTAFNLPVDGEAHFADTAIAGLQEDFTHGAVGCKVWKSYGMELRRANGSHVLVDDPRLAPVFEFLAGAGRPALMHIGDPLAAWQPLDYPSPHQEYFRNNPEWHMAGKQNFPSHSEIMAARDRVVAAHPTLTVVGAHLGSFEHDVDEVAARFDRFPNFYVDISARLADLMAQPPTKVAAFFRRYQDRILFGSDIVLRQSLSALAERDRAALLDQWRTTYEAYFAYLEGRANVEYRGYASAGLDLPPDVLDKVLRGNAERVYKGI